MMIILCIPSGDSRVRQGEVQQCKEACGFKQGKTAFLRNRAATDRGG